MKEEAAPAGPTSGALVPAATNSTTARGRAFARLEWISRPRAAAHDPILEPLISLLRQNHPRADVSIRP